MRLLILPVLVVLVSCGDGRSPLLLYSPHGRDLLSVIEEAFEAEHPQIDLRYLDMGSQEVYDRVRSERANPQADVWFGGPSTIFARAAADELLEPHVPSWSSATPPETHGPGDRYFSLYRTPTFIVYNNDAVTEEDAPQDWDDLLLPRWADQILIRDPLASGTMRTIFGSVVAMAIESTGSPDEGFDWLRKLDAQTKEYVHSPALLHEKMVRQEGLVTLWEMTDILSLIARGAPLSYRFPSSGAPVIEDSIGLVKGGPRPDLGRLFIEWVGEPGALRLAAEQAFRLPARAGLEDLPSWVSEIEARLVSRDVDWTLLEEQGAQWMGRWDREVRARGR